ncbi:MAG: YbhB/YbcL family Raf kinase inhibitor-like protein [Candidatus Levybacteria bacterium]|nr:YbhB/YbcL family Raf kinase inhibitor-like protein [Candidatus Levybacteria bacterium]
MRIISSAFENNQKIPSKYTCDGENVNPPLQFVDVPGSAKSLVLIVDDPDAPSKTWVHWVIYNIDPKISKIGENSKPEIGIEGMTNFGKPGWGGPCPPSGSHRYFFKLYALDDMLNLTSGAGKKEVIDTMNSHVIASSELIGLYSRAK